MQGRQGAVHLQHGHIRHQGRCYERSSLERVRQGGPDSYVCSELLLLFRIPPRPSVTTFDSCRPPGSSCMGHLCCVSPPSPLPPEGGGERGREGERGGGQERGRGRERGGEKKAANPRLISCISKNGCTVHAWVSTVRVCRTLPLFQERFEAPPNGTRGTRLLKISKVAGSRPRGHSLQPSAHLPGKHAHANRGVPLAQARAG